MLTAQNWSPLAFEVGCRYTRPMRKYLDIPLTLIVLLALTVAMLWPLDQPPPAPAGSDKIVHFIAFAALAFPLARTGRFGLMPVFIGASMFGGAIELIQPTFNRSADVNDWAADMIGVLLGIAGGLLYRRIRGR
ncbi:VanZ family protein [Planktomarina temperata]|nr:VanZ family protein [Planktomarina temperata]